MLQAQLKRSFTNAGKVNLWIKRIPINFIQNNTYIKGVVNISNAVFYECKSNNMNMVVRVPYSAKHLRVANRFFVAGGLSLVFFLAGIQSIHAHAPTVQYTRPSGILAATYVMGQAAGVNGSTNNALNNTTISTCGGTFTDPGGVSTDYGNNQNYTLTFTSNSGGPITFDFGTTFASQSNVDYLEIFDGPSTASRLLYKISGVHSGANNKVGQLSSTGTSLTFHFVSNSATTGVGWSASISCSPVETTANACVGNLASLFVFREDFTPLIPPFPNYNIGPALSPASLTGYTYKSVPDTNSTSYMVNDGEYAIVTNAIYGGSKVAARAWSNFKDHTTGNGYMMLVNANYDPDTVYEKTIAGLNPNTVYFVSAWIHTASSPTSITSCTNSSPAFGNIKNANIDFKVFDAGNNLVAINSTGNIQPADPDPAGWRQYNTYYKTKAGETSFRFQITNRASGGCGNDFAVDDIEVRECPSGNVYLLASQLIHFNATVAENKYVAIEWVTAEETNSNYFTVQRSKDGISWEDASSVKAACNSAIARTYNQYDYSPFSGASYYRIRLEDLNGKATYSAAKKVAIARAAAASVVTVTPNPFTEKIKMMVNLTSNQQVKINLFDMAGRIVYSNTHAGIKGSNTFFAENLSAVIQGIYTVLITTGEKTEHIKLLKQ